MLFQIISFFFLHVQVYFLVGQPFFICLILFLDIFFNIFCIFLVWERFVLCPCFTRILPIRINPFWNWFLLFSFFLTRSCNKFISLLIWLISLLMGNCLCIYVMGDYLCLFLIKCVKMWTYIFTVCLKCAKRLISH